MRIGLVRGKAPAKVQSRDARPPPRGQILTSIGAPGVAGESGGSRTPPAESDAGKRHGSLSRAHSRSVACQKQARRAEARSLGKNVGVLTAPAEIVKARPNGKAPGTTFKLLAWLLQFSSCYLPRSRSEIISDTSLEARSACRWSGRPGATYAARVYDHEGRVFRFLGVAHAASVFKVATATLVPLRPSGHHLFAGLCFLVRNASGPGVSIAQKTMRQGSYLDSDVSCSGRQCAHQPRPGPVKMAHEHVLMKSTA